MTIRRERPISFDIASRNDESELQETDRQALTQRAFNHLAMCREARSIAHGNRRVARNRLVR